MRPVMSLLAGVALRLCLKEIDSLKIVNDYVNYIGILQLYNWRVMQ